MVAALRELEVLRSCLTADGGQTTTTQDDDDYDNDDDDYAVTQDPMNTPIK